MTRLPYFNTPGSKSLSTEAGNWRHPSGVLIASLAKLQKCAQLENFDMNGAKPTVFIPALDILKYPP